MCARELAAGRQVLFRNIRAHGKTVCVPIIGRWRVDMPAQSGQVHPVARASYEVTRDLRRNDVDTDAG
jgi:hypothetical protein